MRRPKPRTARPRKTATNTTVMLRSVQIESACPNRTTSLGNRASAAAGRCCASKTTVRSGATAYVSGLRRVRMSSHQGRPDNGKSAQERKIPEESEHLAWGDAEAQTVDGGDLAELLDEVTNLNGRGRIGIRPCPQCRRLAHRRPHQGAASVHEASVREGGSRALGSIGPGALCRRQGAMRIPRWKHEHGIFSRRERR